MSWMRYLIHDWWTAREFNEMEERLQSIRRLQGRRRISTLKRLEELEDALGRIALLTRALGEACLRKGVLTPKELNAVVAEIDLMDGKPDGKLEVSELRPETEEPRQSGHRPRSRRRHRRDYRR